MEILAPDAPFSVTFGFYGLHREPTGHLVSALLYISLGQPDVTCISHHKFGTEHALVIEANSPISGNMREQIRHLIQNAAYLSFISETTITRLVTDCPPKECL